MSLVELIPLKELPNKLPRRNGKKVHYSTLIRWATIGIKGRKLRTVQIGGGLYTSMEAVEEFARPSDPIGNPKPDVSSKSVEAAERELDAMGI